MQARIPSGFGAVTSEDFVVDRGIGKPLAGTSIA
jgi:hypothetical protein